MILHPDIKLHPLCQKLAFGCALIAKAEKHGVCADIPDFAASMARSCDTALTADGWTDDEMAFIRACRAFFVERAPIGGLH